MAMEQHGAGLAVVSLQLGIRSKPVIPYQGRSVMISPVAIVGIHKVLKQGSEDVQHPDRGNDCCGPGSRVTALGALTTVATSAVEILQLQLYLSNSSRSRIYSWSYLHLQYQCMVGFSRSPDSMADRQIHYSCCRVTDYANTTAP